MNTLTINKYVLSEASTKRLAIFLADIEEYRESLIQKVMCKKPMWPFNYKSREQAINLLKERIMGGWWGIEVCIDKAKEFDKQIQTACRVAEGDVIIIDMETCQKIFGGNDED